jgi:hypothetical protein
MSGFGLDYIWCRLSADFYQKCAMIDSISVRHTRPIGKTLRRNMLANGAVPEVEEQILLARYSAQRRGKPLIYAAIDARHVVRKGRRRLGVMMAIAYLKVYSEFSIQERPSWKILQLLRRQLVSRLYKLHTSQLARSPDYADCTTVRPVGDANTLPCLEQVANVDLCRATRSSGERGQQLSYRPATLAARNSRIV